jgi:hypothetical protein
MSKVPEQETTRTSTSNGDKKKIARERNIVTNMAGRLYGQHRLMFNLPTKRVLAVLWQVTDYRS